MRLKVLLVSVITLIVLTACAQIEYEEIDNEDEIESVRRGHFYQEGDIIEEETFSIEEVETESVEDEQKIWYSYDMQTDMYNLVMELKNNHLLNQDIIYLHDSDADTISIYDALEIYEMFKGKVTKSSSRITFSSNDELASLLGLRNEEYVEAVYSSIIEYTNGERKLLVSDYDTVFYYNEEGLQCSKEDAVISFYINEDTCDIEVTDDSLCNLFNIGNYIIFINDITKAEVLDSSAILTTSDGYEIYLDTESFIASLEGIGYEYFNKLEDFCDIYGFVVDVDFAATNSQFVAEMYTLLDTDNVWSDYLIKNKTLNSKTIIKKYIVT